MIATILIVIAALIAAILLAALFISKTYSIVRDIIILNNKREIFNYIRYLKNQDLYSKWVMTDPVMKKDFRGTDGTVGFVYAWDSENKSAGKGEQQIIDIQEDQSIDAEIRFEKPFVGIANTRISTETISEDHTKVTWSMKGEQKYPMNLMNLFIDKMLGKDLDISLKNLKNILEK
jgi:hypothetical protein